jgi:hypothetical protein
MEREFTVEREVNFNGRIRANLSVTARSLQPESEEIATRKRGIYERLAVRRVPALDLDKATLFSHANLNCRKLAKLVHFEPFLVRAAGTTTGDEKVDWSLDFLFQLFVNARENGLFNHFLDELTPERGRVSHDLYLDQRYYKERQWAVTRIRRGVKIWLTYANNQATSLDAFLSYVSSGTQNATLTAGGVTFKNLSLSLGLRATRWAPFVDYHLYSLPMSPLKGSDPTRGKSRFLIVAVDPDNESHYKWHEMVSDYWARNPIATSAKERQGQNAKTSLQSRPHDYDLLNRESISFVALDRDHHDEPFIAAYIVCSLKTVLTAAPTKQFESEELNQFARSLEERRDTRSTIDCGYDVFSIDGLHVSLTQQEGERPYRAGSGVAKLLVFHALLFILRAHRQLGVTLVISGAEAVQTKVILTSFAFGHYNRENDLEWLIFAFQDFHTTILGGKKYPARGTVVKLLDVEDLLRRLREYGEKYLANPPEEAEEEKRQIRGIKESFDAVQRIMRQVLGAPNVESLLKGKIEETVDALFKAWKTLGEIAVKQDGGDGGGSYQGGIRRWLDTGVDTQDTFLFLGQLNLPFENAVATFAKAFLSDDLPVNGLLAPTAGVLPEELRPEELRTEELRPEEEDGRVASQTSVNEEAEANTRPIEPDNVLEPNAGDLEMYDAWIKSIAPQPYPQRPPTRLHKPRRQFVLTDRFTLTAEEKERERASMAREIASLESEADELRARLTALEEQITLKRANMDAL